MGYRPNDEIALYMNNRPEFIGIWLGLAKIGVIAVLINTNNKNETLIHAITVINCKAIIYDTQFSDAINEIADNLSNINPLMNYYCFGNNKSEKICAKLLQNELSQSSKTLPSNIHKCNFGDKLFYAFTSGTTGFPKAAIILHSRFLWGGTTYKIVLNFKQDDIVYISLPLYHATAGILGTAQALLHGNSIVLREKFSATHFWDDCVHYKCTIAVYIGEICRYLLAQPVRYNDTHHQIRIMFGNGLRSQIWRDFVKRFKVNLIAEFYASTEGNANLINYTGHEGAVGFYPYYFKLGKINIVNFLYPITLIKVNSITHEVLRSKDGLCVIAKPGDTGQIVGKIVESDPVSQFAGYVSSEDNNKKIITNVFKKGDKVFLSGDLMQIDINGFLYFRDRIGDTFRWKGENVSTNEVEAILQKVTNLSDCLVFGVSIHNYEGKAGMAVISYESEQTIEFILRDLGEQLIKHLPLYSVPLFVRLSKNIELTGSYKLIKFTFIKNGFNPALTTDCIYFFDKSISNYIQLDSELYEKIQSGKIKL